MHPSKVEDDYDKIMLSFKERRVLRRILKRHEVPADFCTPKQTAFLKTMAWFALIATARYRWGME